MYKALINIHVYSSILFVLVAIIVNIKSFQGIYYKKPYKKMNKNLEIAFILLLYLGFVLGIILYFFLNVQHKQKMLTLEESLQNSRQQFWAVEHFSVMLVSLILAQIGKIFTGKNIL